MKKFCVLVIVLACLFSTFYAQNGGVANHWHFGHYAGLDFSAGCPLAVSSPIYTQEGVATFSDINGNLLFSTDGIYVYNRNKLQMPNGFGLLGNSSATQSSIIVPNPANANQFYIFTVASEFDSAGIQYAMVDMSLDGGLGDISLKNIPLLSPAAGKITAIKHCNHESYWVICHKWESDAFYAYEISNIGIQPPVISHVGSVYQGIYLNAVGYLKSSSNGKRLAAAIYGVDSSNIEMFDFNDATGTISNPTYIPAPEGAYGVSFSPDNTKLYVSFISSYTLVQYDLLATDIANSAYLLGNSSAKDVISGTYYLQVTDSHNCTEEISVYIPHYSRPTAQYISSPTHDFVAIYEGDSIHFFPQTLGADSYFWDFGDGTFSTEPQPVHVFGTIGKYLVTLTVYDKDKICPDTYALLYKIVANCNRLYIPNVFTPNGDGKNDFFKFVGTQSNFEATLFDRWGRVITQFDSIDDSWNGENAPEGVYAYKLKVVCEMGLVVYRGGTFTLIR